MARPANFTLPGSLFNHWVPGPSCHDWNDVLLPMHFIPKLIWRAIVIFPGFKVIFLGKETSKKFIP